MKKVLKITLQGNENIPKLDCGYNCTTFYEYTKKDSFSCFK